MTLGALIRLPLWNGMLADRRADSLARWAGVTMEVGRDQAYNEEAFHYFLGNERQRALVSNRPVVLLLVEHARAWSDSAPAKLLSGLSRCLRDTDIVGWYRADRVAGAVLTHLADGPVSDAVREVQRRVEASLKEFSPRVRVRTLVPDSDSSEMVSLESEPLGPRAFNDTAAAFALVSGERS